MFRAILFLHCNSCEFSFFVCLNFIIYSNIIVLSINYQATFGMYCVHMSECWF